MPLTMRRFAIGKLMLAVLIAGCQIGCSAAPRLAEAGKSPASAPLVPPLASLAELTPDTGGPGIVICEPVIMKADSRQTDFGAGCSRWLQFVVGGQSELGQTPLWSEITQATADMHLTDLRLSVTQAVPFGQSLGATHVAVGQLEGDDTKATLSYQLYTVPEGKPQGEPFTATGSRDEIAAALSGMAMQMLARLGVEKLYLNRVPAEAPGLEAIGAFPRVADRLPVTDARVARLLPFADHSPVAAILLVPNFSTRVFAVQTLSNIGAGNTYALSAATEVGAHILADREESIAASFNSFPKNYQLATAAAAMAKYSGHWDLGRSAGRHSVRSAPRNPFAWQAFGDLIHAEANSTRHGRFYGELSEAEAATIEPLYALAQAAQQKSVDLNPRRSAAWKGLSTAAMFRGDRRIATDSLWKSIELDPLSRETYAWGVEMMQPKWGGTEAELVKLGEKAFANPKLFPTVSSNLLNGLTLSTMQSDGARRLVLRCISNLLPYRDTQYSSQEYNTPGILICEPVFDNKSAALGAFGAGSGRWLHFAVGGQAELGQTPGWHEIDYARRQAKFANLRLSIQQAAKIAALLGVKKVAVGAITGNGAACTLTYRLYDVAAARLADPDSFAAVYPDLVVDRTPAYKPSGAPFVVKGSMQQVIAALPRLGRQMTLRIGLATPHLPASVGASAAELSNIGKLPWQIHQPLKGGGAQSLLSLASRHPLAGMIALGQATPTPRPSSLWSLDYTLSGDQVLAVQLARRLIKQAPDNALAWEQISWQTPLALKDNGTQLYELGRKYRQNALLSLANGRRDRLWHIYSTEWVWNAVRCNTASPLHWIELSQICTHLAELGRSDSTRYRLTTYSTNIRQVLAALGWNMAKRAVDQDDRNAEFQMVLATAYHEAGYKANEQLDAALKLDPTNIEIYRCGLKIYKTRRWEDDSTDLRGMIKLATANEERATALSLDLLSVMWAWKPVSRDKALEAVLVKSWERLRKLEAESKNSAAAQARFAEYYAPKLQPDKARPAFAAWVRMRPLDYYARLCFGRFLFEDKDYPAAVEQLREANRLRSNNSEILVYLGASLFHVNSFEEAESLLRQGVKIAPERGLAHYYLGKALYAQGKKPEARAEWLETINLHLVTTPEQRYAYRARDELQIDNPKEEVPPIE